MLVMARHAIYISSEESGTGRSPELLTSQSSILREFHANLTLFLKKWKGWMVPEECHLGLSSELHMHTAHVNVYLNIHVQTQTCISTYAYIPTQRKVYLYRFLYLTLIDQGGLTVYHPQWTESPSVLFLSLLSLFPSVIELINQSYVFNGEEQPPQPSGITEIYHTC